MAGVGGQLSDIRWGGLDTWGAWVGGEWEVSFTINSLSSVDLIDRVDLIARVDLVGGEWEGNVRLRQGLG
jgi:hypothetical protein